MEKDGRDEWMPFGGWSSLLGQRKGPPGLSAGRDGEKGQTWGWFEVGGTCRWCG